VLIAELEGHVPGLEASPYRLLTVSDEGGLLACLLVKLSLAA